MLLLVEMHSLSAKVSTVVVAHEAAHVPESLIGSMHCGHLSLESNGGALANVSGFWRGGVLANSWSICSSVKSLNIFSSYGTALHSGLVTWK